MIKARESIVINRPLDEVFQFVSDVDKWDEWAAEMVEVTKTSEGPVDVDSTFTAVVKFLGQRIENEHKVTEYEPGSRLGITVTSGPVRGRATFIFESVNGGTQVTEAMQGDGGGFFKIADPIVNRMVQRQYAANLANLKDLLEARG